MEQASDVSVRLSEQPRAEQPDEKRLVKEFENARKAIERRCAR